MANKPAGPSGDNKKRGYIIQRYRAPRLAVDYARDLVRHLDEDTQRFFFHVLACATMDPWDEGYVPVASLLIRRKARRASWQRLCDEDLFGVPHEYSKAKGLSREFQVSRPILEGFVWRIGKGLKESAPRTVNLFTGKECAPARTRLTDESRHRVGTPGSPLREAMPIYQASKVYFHRERAAALLDVRYERVRRADHQVRLAEARSDAAEVGEALRVRQREFYALTNDLSCYKEIIGQQPTPAPHLGEGVWQVQVRYVPQRSGRLSVVGGGFQSASRPMKYAAFSGLPGLHNYDLRSSQVRGMLQRFEEANAEGASLSTDWLAEYDRTAQAKHTFAAQAGLPVGAWKEILCATMMGCAYQGLSGEAVRARQANRAEETEMKRQRHALEPTVQRVLLREVGEEGFAQALSQLKSVTGSLVHERDKWHRHLTGPYLEKHAFGSRGGRQVRNEAGAVFTVDEPDYAGRKGQARLGRRLAAFLLQGLEAAFIHALVVLSAEYGYEVVQNEHDGLITLGEIPAEAVGRAAQRVGLRYADLTEKPFDEVLTADDLPPVLHLAERPEGTAQEPMRRAA